MSAFTNLAEDDFLDHFFTNTTFPNVGDAAGLLPSAVAGNLYASLHENDAVSDTTTLQTDNETTYTGYARFANARSTAGWTVLTGTVDNDVLNTFGEMTAGGPVTITDVILGFAASGAGVAQIHGQVTSDLIVNNGINPQFAIGALDVSID